MDSVHETLTKPCPAKIAELAERGGYGKSLEDRQSLEHAIEMGRGGIWLELTEQHYRKLKHRCTAEY